MWPHQCGRRPLHARPCVCEPGAPCMHACVGASLAPLLANAAHAHRRALPPDHHACLACLQVRRTRTGVRPHLTTMRTLCVCAHVCAQNRGKRKRGRGRGRGRGHLVAKPGAMVTGGPPGTPHMCVCCAPSWLLAPCACTTCVLRTVSVACTTCVLRSVLVARTMCCAPSWLLALRTGLWCGRPWVGWPRDGSSTGVVKA